MKLKPKLTNWTLKWKASLPRFRILCVNYDLFSSRWDNKREYVAPFQVKLRIPNKKQMLVGGTLFQGNLDIWIFVPAKLFPGTGRITESGAQQSAWPLGPDRKAFRGNSCLLAFTEKGEFANDTWFGKVILYLMSVQRPKYKIGDAQNKQTKEQRENNNISCFRKSACLLLIFVTSCTYRHVCASAMKKGTLLADNNDLPS